jgi:hypothetical protein
MSTPVKVKVSPEILSVGELNPENSKLVVPSVIVQWFPMGAVSPPVVQ